MVPEKVRAPDVLDRGANLHGSFLLHVAGSHDDAGKLQSAPPWADAGTANAKAKTNPIPTEILALVIVASRSTLVQDDRVPIQGGAR